MHTQSDPYSQTDELSVSIVVYRPNLAELAETLTSLAAACERLRASRPDFSIKLYLIDNGGLRTAPAALDAFRVSRIDWEILSGQGNVGYGRGHNLAIERTSSHYHLVLNPDIDLDGDALAAGLAFFDAHSDTGLLTPWIGDDRGQQQYLCRRYPSLLDLFVRGFLPARLRRLFARRLAAYEMRDQIDGKNVRWDPPIVSGCFMLFRTEVLKKLGGFDPRYFLYFEDYDLSLRTHDVARVAYVPSVRVIHHGGGASRKGFAHIRMFAASAFKFYNRFGWRLW
ncbi:glycosyltransferase family 2 protein [Burkholderia vietnamiensis]|uniref:glycosyltransferase family 2 protein n=1 Tax=Burkholderia vietnamiensis TaxID=60552 RepID=UPI00075523D1|nr:glycosyltransferase family 2 protein [Burkholderia vietnamiensis]KVR88529.1 glycosyl transferase [Burkholderia vietnamiensis]KVS32316.1 glycosyl transferase [Burkholderia vietnamiensis]MBR8002137.1 glycosyltransferase family 2 protein [Burkholderia vietnamiensis]MCA7948568.1 glycosyltransferase family 2 protein [Burkholderia vietnamiensis]HDR9004182.1 glycosyltransferase family 2 protein [Burkholderia vietnamiensis]